MTTDALLTELERQRKYLDRLPESFQFPLFNAKHALESQRRSGYRNTASAAREIVDNSIEAGADRIHVVFDTERDGANKRKVQAIAFIDNGPGMLPRMARYALSWGGGTHFDDPTFIGKFGFGLPNASINQTRLLEVYTRTERDQRFTKAWLNLSEYREFGVQEVPEPVEDELPGFVQDYIDRNNLGLPHGTVVVWVYPDRLTYKKAALLKEHLVDDFGVTYRYLLVNPERPVELIVEGVPVQPVDPLFVMSKGRYYVPPQEGGAEVVEDISLSVKYYIDPDTEERHLEQIQDLSELAEQELEDPNLLGVGPIHIKVVYLPDPLLEDKNRMQLRQAYRGISFVRGGREVQTGDLFPRSRRARENGLGSWPVLQSYALYWGVEVSFEPELDEVFGITNDKQGVRPLEDFWRVLTQAGVDQALHRAQNRHRKEVERKPRVDSSENATPGELAARDADLALGSIPHVPEEQRDEAKASLDEEAERRAEITQRSVDETRDAFLKEAKRRPYKIDYFDQEDGPFYRPNWVGTQLVIYINRQHPFYQVLYGDLVQLQGGARALDAVNILLITLARGELTSEQSETVDWYGVQRKQVWSPFLANALNSLRARVPSPEVVTVVEEVERAPVEAA